MGHQHTQPTPDRHSFDQELRALYQASLLDEAFQQQVIDDLHSLPQAVQQRLHGPERLMLDETSLDRRAQSRLLGALSEKRQPCQQSVSVFGRLKAGWRGLFAPLVALPTTLVVGVLLGLFLPLAWQVPTPVPEDVLRGPTPPATSASVPDTGSAGQTEIPDTLRQQPQSWLAAIADLLRQGKVVQAREELQTFELLYPDYQPPSP